MDLPLICPETNLEESIVHSLLLSLEESESREAVQKTLTVIRKCFVVEYSQMMGAFISQDGVHRMEVLIARYAEDYPIIQMILEILLYLLQDMNYAIRLDHNTLIGICIQILLRCKKEAVLIKLSLKIIASLCLYRWCCVVR